MPDYRVVEATREHVEAMAPHMRAADVAEVLAATGADPRAALLMSWRVSTHRWAGLAGDEVACIFGVAPINLLARRGAPWLLGTDLIAQHGRAFLRRNRRYIHSMMSVYNHLENHVDARNTVSIEWLRWLGFTFDEPAPFGVAGLPFRRFEMRG